MSLHTGLVFIFTILASVSIVAAIILLGKQAPADSFSHLVECKLHYSDLSLILIALFLFCRLVFDLESFSL